MATIHMLLQGKGGVGKSLVASLLFQYLNEHGFTVKGCDTDPVNSTFSGYKEFDVQPLDIMDGDDIDQRRFDQLMETLSETPEEAHMIVDNGASCFVALCGYLKENGALSFLQDSGHEIFIHTVVTGGQALPDTLKGLRSLTLHFPDVPIVVWLNPYYGPIVLDGSDFYGFKVYAEASATFKAIIELPALKPATFGRDFGEMLAKRASFEASIKSPRLHLMARQRLVMVWRNIKQVIDQAGLIDVPHTVDPNIRYPPPKSSDQSGSGSLA
ncbi:conjugal transfer protein TraL [Deltaproteobacteria bacterium OttesenSCG-928-M10]|nr:conjugal transfer protein TraL [Deltaproteobacteria bacterium OttesenSCG-928-M10]